MASEKAVYWTAVAILGVFLGNHFAVKYHDGRCAERAEAAIQALTGDATDFLSMAQEMMAGTPRFAGSEMAVAQIQDQVASMEAAMARQQAACARVEAQHARLMALQQMQHIRVICPGQNIRLSVPQVPVVHGDGTI